MERLVWRIGSALTALERHRIARLVVPFVLLWVGGTLALHFIPRWYGRPTFVYGWATAAALAIVIAVLGTAIGRWFSR